MDHKALQKELRTLLAQSWSDEQLRTRLEQLADAAVNFSGLTWLWAPELYRRNRVMFRPLILARFGRVLRTGRYSWKSVPWKGEVAESLAAWLEEVDRLDDVELFRRLYDWKLSALSNLRIGPRQNAILKDLAARFAAAPGRAARELVLRKFDLWFELTEPAARALYGVDRVCGGPYILRHLPWAWREDGRPFWEGLLADAERAGDEGFRWDLYRRQVPRSRWESDLAAVCERVSAPDALVRELERRHPGGFNRSLGGGLLLCLEKRGLDALPYVRRHLRDVRSGLFTDGDYGRLLAFARSRAWWELWAGVIRACAPPKQFNQEIQALVADRSLARPDKVLRLRALAGVSREFNFVGMGFAAVSQLTEETALVLLDEFPELLREPFRAHLQIGPWSGSYAKLITRLIERGEDDLLDHVAARLATRGSGWISKTNTLLDAERLSEHYAALKADPAVFSRRAASVLGRIPAYSIYSYGRLICENRLARLLFERSARDYLADPEALRDLVEASEIHVMALGYRALGLDDERARALAPAHLPLLLGTLLRPLHRATRLEAFRALANAASATPEGAARILAKAREALDLPDENYPKEALLGLIASILDRWPALRGPAEEPLVYGRRAA